MTLLPDDPRLTAYVLGELTEAERVEIENVLRTDPALSAEVEAMRAFQNEIEAALQASPSPAFARLPEAVKEQARDEKKILRFVLPPAVTRWSAAAGIAVLAWFGLLREFQMGTRHENEIRAKNKPTEIFDGYVTSDAPTVFSAPATPASPPPIPEEKPLDEKLGAKDQLALSLPAQAGEKKEAAKSDDGSSRAARQESELIARVDVPAAPVLQLQPMQTPALPSRQSALGKSIAQASLDGRMEMSDEATVYKFDKQHPLYPLRQNEESNTEGYSSITENEFTRVDAAPLSTFSIDVDTASYSNVRRFLEAGRRPPASAVRIEELVNYFPYDYAKPIGADPVAISLDQMQAPWSPEHTLVRVGLRARDIDKSEREPANLVFLIDVSGSMNQPNKLPLVIDSLKLLVNALNPADRVALAVYAGSSGLVLPSTPVTEKETILNALGSLQAGGSTNGAQGIRLAYEIAAEHFQKSGANRVILCTDGDFNVGVTSEGELVDLIREKAKSRIFLTVLGFGRGNLKDSTMEKLADSGNGTYGYIDTKQEARKLFVEQLSGTLVTVAKDVKVQVEFNPSQVAAYRLIGYENRALAAQDFNNDRKDAGEMGAGHTVTALYEVVPTKQADGLPGVDALKYQRPAKSTIASTSSEMLTVKIRYKHPLGDVSKLVSRVLETRDVSLKEASSDLRFAAAVAGFGMLLRNSPNKGNLTWNQVLELAQQGLSFDPGEHRREFVKLVRRLEQ